ncbi:thioredoxin domain-containing protein 5 homolog [Actinia tenebrosa]|uniref:Thioredoxin domain-containing protein 5 homolog n=1 Tax=Actinia tenebrosa TaxID=6105 RepID=A0A6P8ID50_ACTTE|nr:thioredoxin domain-containing protein 5 homolog [Actinia tenebrosa]
MNGLVSLAGLLMFIFKISTAQVLELNDGNFLETVTGHPLLLVEFYSPKCPFCQKLAPVYEQAAKKLHDIQPSLQVAKVDCTNDACNVTCTKSNVRYVPWIIMFKNGAQSSVFGDRKRDEDTIVKFVTDVVSNTTEKQQDVIVPKIPPINACDEHPPPSAEVPTTIPAGLPVTELTDATFADFIKSSPYVIVDYYAPWCSDCQRLSPLYDEAALQLQKTNPKIKFAKVDCNRGNVPTFSICAASKLKFFPWVVLFHNGEPVQHYDQENIPNTATIYNFIKSGTQANDVGSVVQQLDDSSFDSMISTHPYVMVDFYAPWCFYCKKMAPIYDELATELKDPYPSLRLVKVDCTVTNPKTKTTCTKNDIAFLPTLKLFQNGKFLKEYEGDKTNKGTISSFVTDVVGVEQSAKRTTMNSTKTNNDKTKQLEKKDKKSKKELKKDNADEEGSLDKVVEKEDNEKKLSKENKNKKENVSKKSRKEKSRVDRAAQILKKVFKQFKIDKLTKTKKHRKYEDDDEEEDSDSNRNSWQQVVRDIHQVAKDIHKMTREFTRAVSNKQPGVDRLVKAFNHLVKSKDEDEDEY